MMTPKSFSDTLPTLDNTMSLRDSHVIYKQASSDIKNSIARLAQYFAQANIPCFSFIIDR